MFIFYVIIYFILFGAALVADRFRRERTDTWYAGHNTTNLDTSILSCALASPFVLILCFADYIFFVVKKEKEKKG